MTIHQALVNELDDDLKAIANHYLANNENLKTLLAIQQTRAMTRLMKALTNDQSFHGHGVDLPTLPSV